MRCVVMLVALLAGLAGGCLEVPPADLVADAANPPADGGDGPPGVDAGPAVDRRARVRSIGASGVTPDGLVATIAEGSDMLSFASALPAWVGPGDVVTIGAEVLYLAELLPPLAARVDVPSAVALQDGALVTRAFPDVQAWVAGRARDLVAAEEREVGVLYDDVPVTSPPVLDGFLTSAAFTVTLAAAPGREHLGRESAGVAFIGPAPTCLDVLDDHVVLRGLRFGSCGDATGGEAIRIVAVEGVLLDRVLVHDFPTDTTVGAVGIRVRDGASVSVRNSIVVDGRTAFSVSGGAAVTVQSSTFFRLSGRLANIDAAAMTVSNTIAVDVTYIDSDTGPFDHIVSDAGIAGATVASADELFVKTDLGEPDVHLRAGAPAIDIGADLSAEFDLDVDGTARTGAWDVGADER